MSENDLEFLKNKLSEIQNPSSGGSDFHKKFINVELGGEKVIRILPWKDENFRFVKEYSAHRWDNANVTCLRDLDQKCPVCEVYFALWKTGDDNNIKLARSIKASKKYWMNAVDRDTDEVKILAAPKTLFECILATSLDPEYGPVYDLKDGFDYRVKKVKGSNGFTDYKQSIPSRKESVAGDDQAIDRYMGSLHDIHEMIKYKSYEEMEKVAAQILASNPGVETVSSPLIDTQKESNSAEALTKLLND
tara:strand:+ start:6106 stop:6849 length:744 start_codon:yes stop_codon:yes gene_type:complete